MAEQTAAEQARDAIARIDDGHRPHRFPLAALETEADAEFIAHARADVPALVALVERLRAEVEEAEANEGVAVAEAEAAEAERDAAVARADTLAAQVDRVRALIFRRYTGSPAFDETPEDVREIDAIGNFYDYDFATELRAALQAPAEGQLASRPTDDIQQQVAAVRAIHRRTSGTSGTGPWCEADGRRWPCSTIAALDGGGE